jgi:hypothetical protein
VGPSSPEQGNFEETTMKGRKLKGLTARGSLSAVSIKKHVRILPLKHTPPPLQGLNRNLQRLAQGETIFHIHVGV